MPLRAIHIGAPEWWTPAHRQKEKDPPGFKVRGLDGSQQADVMPEVILSAGDSMTFTSQGIRLMFKYGLADWRGVLDHNDNEIEFASLSPLEVQRLLPISDQTAIASEIFRRSFLEPTDKKK